MAVAGVDVAGVDVEEEEDSEQTHATKMVKGQCLELTYITDLHIATEGVGQFQLTVLKPRLSYNYVSCTLRTHVFMWTLLWQLCLLHS